jgi:AraC-like DNA-binding protein
MDFDATLEMINMAVFKSGHGLGLHICLVCITSLALQKLYAIPFVYLSWQHVRSMELRLMDDYSDGIGPHIAWLNVLAAALVIYAVHGMASLTYILLTNRLTLESWIYFPSLVICLFIQFVAIAALLLPEGFVTAVADLPVRSRRIPVEGISADRYVRVLQEFMVSNKPHRIAGIRLAELAAMVSMPSRVLSELINERFKTSYHDFINSYRVEDAKSMLCDAANDQFTLLALAREAGFKSKTSFNRVFKKHTGMSPSAYRSSGPVNEAPSDGRLCRDM